MKSTELYAILRQEVGPWAKEEGFRRAKAMLSWWRPYGDLFVVFWFQAWQHGWDNYAGSKFTVEFQIGPEPAVGWFEIRRARLPRLLDEQAREVLRLRQNEVISALPRPPANHPFLHAPGNVPHYYLSQFDTVDRPYAADFDIWLRYYSAEDVHAWGQFVRQHLPHCIEQVEGWELTSAST